MTAKNAAETVLEYWKTLGRDFARIPEIKVTGCLKSVHRPLG
jgi:hypothetical protein